jgi:hypothetical protein
MCRIQYIVCKQKEANEVQVGESSASFILIPRELFNRSCLAPSNGRWIVASAPIQFRIEGNG